MAYSSMGYRAAVAMVYILHIFSGAPWTDAYAAVQTDEDIGGFLPELKNKKQAESMRKRALFWGKRLIRKQDLGNKQRVNMKKVSSITPDEARLAAFLLKTGWHEYKQKNGRWWKFHHYFTSLKQALRKCPQLKAIYQKFVEPNPNKKRRQFMRQLYKYDELLRVRRLHIKYELDLSLKKQRRNRGASLLRRLEREPDLLERILFVDECAIIFDHEISKGAHVYCDAHDKDYRFVIPFKKADPNKKIKVRIMAAVNYHTGAFFLEFTTGTSKIQRRFNLPPQPGVNWRYQVSHILQLH